MSSSIKIAGAAFTKTVAELPPYLDLAQLFLLLGGDAASSTKNYAGTGAAATVIGTPVYQAGYCALSAGANGFEAPMVAGKSPFTHIAVVTPISDNASGYCGNWVGAGSAANILNKTVSGLSLAIDGNQRANAGPLAAANFQLIAGSHDGATATAHRGSAGALTSVTAAYAGGAVTSAKFRIGANLFGTGTFNAAAAMTFNSVLSSAQITSIYGYLTRLLAGRGITVA